MVPVLDDGTDTYRVIVGAHDAVSVVDATDGYYLKYNKGVNGTSFVFVTSANSVRTTTSTGVAVVAGTWYRVRIQLTNNSTVSCFIVPDVNGWDYGAAVATNTTNIPTGAGRETSISAVGILKSAGTNSRSVAFTRHTARNEPIRSAGAIAVSAGTDDGIGLPAPALGQILGVNSAGLPVWSERVLRDRKLGYLSIDNVSSTEWITTSIGTGASLVNTASTDSGYACWLQPITGTTSTGGALRTNYTPGNTPPITFTPNGHMFVYECLWKQDTLSTTAQTHQTAFGFMDVATVALPSSNAVHFLFDAHADTHMNVMTMAAGTATQVATSLVIVANTVYRCKIVVRMVPGSTLTMQADFYMAPVGTSYTTPIATVTTNIPTAPVGGGLVFVKSNGTTSVGEFYTTQMVYQRLAA